MRNLIRSASIAAFVFAAASAGAQTPSTSSRWQAWIGCWRASADAPTASSRVCVVPASTPSSVEIITLDSGKVLSRYTVDATGAQHAVSREGCDGWERASWSADSLRVFLRSDLKCGSGFGRTSSGIMSITPGGDWVDVQTVVVAANEVVRTVRYMQTNPTADLPENIASAIATTRRLDTRTALAAAGSQLTAANVLEATQAVDTSAVQAWLVERRQIFSVDASLLARMADAGVPGSITDMMVALSYPDRFRFDRDVNTAAGGSSNIQALTALDSARIASSYMRRGDCLGYSSYSPFAWGTDPCFGYYGRYGYSPYYGYRYGYSAYGYSPYSSGYYGYYTRPIVIVRNDDAPQHGKAVNGRGYTRGSSSSSTERASGDSRAASSRSSGSSSSSPSSQSSGSTSSSSSGSSSGSSGASSTSTGRTAHPRPPLE
ncbi:MAG TPA: hypothetical protein VIP11_03985 [Gemmatimonadaceae bacterium]